jgi:hypothetical protein
MTSAFFKNRVIKKAGELKGPRVYSTDLIPTLFDVNNSTASRVTVARALKIKIITKGLVTINCAHLISPLGVRLLDVHPDLFAGKAILPAFREDKGSLADYIESEEDFTAAGIDQAHLQSHIATVDGLIKEVMPWQLGNVGDSFQEALVTGLRAKTSFVYRELQNRGVTEQDIETIARTIEGLDFDEDRDLRDYLETLSEDRRDLVKRFATANYHMIGTGVVQCETGTDLSPLSEFKAADVMLAARDARPELLSEDAIFLEAFMGFALDTIHASVLPSQVIDSLSFTLAHQLSDALRTQGFQTKYDEIISAYSSSLSRDDGRGALESIDPEAVASKARELAQLFAKEIIDQLPNYKTAIQSEASSETYRVGTDIALEGGKAIPVLGTFFVFADIIKKAAEVSQAAVDDWSVRNQNQSFAEAQRRRTEKIRYAIDQLKVGSGSRAKLLDAVASLSDIHGVLTRRA